MKLKLQLFTDTRTLTSRQKYVNINSSGILPFYCFLDMCFSFFMCDRNPLNTAYVRIQYLNLIFLWNRNLLILPSWILVAVSY